MKVEDKWKKFWDSLDEDRKQRFMDSPKLLNQLMNPPDRLKEFVLKEMVRRGLLKH
jgi:hypothetical protein